MPGVAERGALGAFEIDQRALVVENRAQLGVLRGRQIALCLHDEEVGRQAHLELALLGPELFLRQLARGRGRLDLLLDGVDLQRGIGHLGGDLQLDLADLHLRLPDLQARPLVGGPVRALAERIAHPQLHAPERIVGVDDVVDGVAVATRDRAARTAEDRLEGAARGYEPGAALAGQLVAADQVELGQRAVAEVLDLGVVDVELPPHAGDVGALVQRAANRALQVDRRGIDLRLVGRNDLGVPQLVRGAAHDELLQRELVGAQRANRQCQRLPPRRGLRLRLHDVDGREGAYLDARPVVAHELLGQLQRLLLHGDRRPRVHELPVRETHVGQRVDDGLLYVDIRDIAVDIRYHELRALRVGAEAAQQRLCVPQGHAGAEAGIEAREDVVRLQPVAVPGDVILAPAPFHPLVDAEVVGALLADDVAAAEAAAVEQ